MALFFVNSRPRDWDLYRDKSLDDTPITKVCAMITERLNSAD